MLQKPVLAITLLSLSILPSFASAQSDSVPIQLFVECREDYDDLMDMVEVINDEGRGTYTMSDYEDAKTVYEDCHSNNLTIFNQYIKNGATYIEEGDYARALSVYEKGRDLIEEDNFNLENSIVSLYLSLAWKMYQRGEYLKVDDLLDDATDYQLTNYQQYQRYYLRALLASADDDYAAAKGYAEKARTYATTDKERDELADFLAYVTNRALAPTNDQLSYKQPWLEGLRITDAWKKQGKGDKVVVAVIDNGFATDHPDLQGRVWRNSGEKAGNGKDDDGNGYIDDVHGYNFLDDSADITPQGDHGTQVAGIIGAIANNNIGIAGIADNVEMMSLVVCSSETCLQSSELRDPIRYAVDNGADIINMSLIAKNVAFYSKLSESIQYATDHGVIVIAAAGNGFGDATNKVGVNTTQTPLSPVCNYGDDKKRIIGVGATNEKGEKLTWSNYGECVDLYTYGERIVTASLQSKDSDRYLVADGTSFSAPIVAGIVALGHDIYGPKTYDAVYDALQESLDGSSHPDAMKYLSELEKAPTPPKPVTPISSEKQAKINQLFVLIDRQLRFTNVISKRLAYQKYMSALDGYEVKLLKNNDTERLQLLEALRAGFQQRMDKLI